MFELAHEVEELEDGTLLPMVEIELLGEMVGEHLFLIVQRDTSADLLIRHQIQNTFGDELPIDFSKIKLNNLLMLSFWNNSDSLIIWLRFWMFWDNWVMEAN